MIMLLDWRRVKNEGWHPTARSAYKLPSFWSY